MGRGHLLPSTFLFARPNANKESNADAEQQNVQLPSRSESESDVADSEDCTHKRIRHENDISKLRFLSTWCTVRRFEVMQGLLDEAVSAQSKFGRAFFNNLVSYRLLL